MNTHLFFCMRSVLILFLFGGCTPSHLSAHEVVPFENTTEGHCVATEDTMGETLYVEEVLELCKDCDIPAPDVVPPSGIQVWFTKWGIALFYTLNDAKDWISQKIFGGRTTKSPPATVL